MAVPTQNPAKTHQASFMGYCGERHEQPEFRADASGVRVTEGRRKVKMQNEKVKSDQWETGGCALLATDPSIPTPA